MRIWLKVLRMEHGMTSGAVAKAAQISQPVYSQIENGHKNPSVASAKRIAAVMGFDWTRFFEDDEDEGRE